MNWLTIEEIKAAAAESDEAAIRCSIKHWKQIRQATKKELLSAYRKRIVSIHRKRIVSIYNDHCSLCARFNGRLSRCKDCPLGPGTIKCCPEWYEVSDQFGPFVGSGLGLDHTTKHKFNKAADRLIERLESLLE